MDESIYLIKMDEDDYTWCGCIPSDDIPESDCTLYIRADLVEAKDKQITELQSQLAIANASRVVVSDMRGACNKRVEVK